MPAYKNQNRHTWYCSFYFTDWQGKRKKKKKEGFANRQAALAWEREFLELYAGTPDISFVTLVKAYKEHHKENTRPCTHYMKCNIIDTHILPFFSALSVSKIGRQQVQAWKRNLTRKNLRPLYLRQVYNQLKSIFSFAVEHYHLSANPCPSRENFGSHERKMDYWTPDEFRSFVMTLRNPRQIMAFYMLFWTGMRSGEMLALTWEDISFEDNSISVSKSYARLHKQDIITTGKTRASRRIVIMPAFLAAMLQDFRQLTQAREGRIFPCTRGMLTAAIKKGIKAAGVKEIRLHDLRHSHASLLINAGFRPLDVADRLGHSNAGITLSVYTHFYESKRTELAEKLNTII